MTLVYQMAKVASRSWVEAAKQAAPSSQSRPIHCHHVVPSSRERLQAVFSLPPGRQTIANLYLPRYDLRVGASAWEQIEGARRRQEKIRVISGMRDPVARSVSVILYISEFYGHVSRPLNPRAPMTPEYVIGALQENWKLVLERREPDQAFEWVLWYLTDAFRRWFVDELGTAFGVDVLQSGVRGWDALQGISTPSAEIFIYRVEDMLPQAPGYARLLAQANRFLEAALLSFPNVNSSSTRRSAALSAEVRRRFWLPADMLDAIYAEPIVQHFYHPDEILAFKRLWGTSGLQSR